MATRRVLYSSPFIPAEWIAAHGFVPSRYQPETGEAKPGLPSAMGVCPYAQSFLGAAAQHDFATVVFTTSCDQMRRAADCLVSRVGGEPFVFNVPATWQSTTAREMLIAEMLAIHYCSDRAETLAVLEGLTAEAEIRAARCAGVLAPEAIRVFWVNPVADLRVMNLLEECGGRITGTDYMFRHALNEIPEDQPPLEALAQMALADPMVGSAQDRAGQVISDLQRCRAQAVVVSRIPGASHCAREGEIIRDRVQNELGLPTLELEVPPLADALRPALRSRLQALVETAIARRQP
jgi:hypothetical protein